MSSPTRRVLSDLACNRNASVLGEIFPNSGKSPVKAQGGRITRVVEVESIDDTIIPMASLENMQPDADGIQFSHATPKKRRILASKAGLTTAELDAVEREIHPSHDKENVPNSFPCSNAPPSSSSKSFSSLLSSTAQLSASATPVRASRNPTKGWGGTNSGVAAGNHTSSAAGTGKTPERTRFPVFEDGSAREQGTEAGTSAQSRPSFHSPSRAPVTPVRHTGSSSKVTRAPDSVLRTPKRGSGEMLGENTSTPLNGSSSQSTKLWSRGSAGSAGGAGLSSPPRESPGRVTGSLLSNSGGVSFSPSSSSFSAERRGGILRGLESPPRTKMTPIPIDAPSLTTKTHSSNKDAQAYVQLQTHNEDYIYLGRVEDVEEDSDDDSISSPKDPYPPAGELSARGGGKSGTGLSGGLRRGRSTSIGERTERQLGSLHEAHLTSDYHPADTPSSAFTVASTSNDYSAAIGEATPEELQGWEKRDGAVLRADTSSHSAGTTGEGRGLCLSERLAAIEAGLASMGLQREPVKTPSRKSNRSSPAGSPYVSPAVETIKVESLANDMQSNISSITGIRAGSAGTLEEVDEVDSLLATLSGRSDEVDSLLATLSPELFGVDEKTPTKTQHKIKSILKNATANDARAYSAEQKWSDVPVPDPLISKKPIKEPENVPFVSASPQTPTSGSRPTEDAPEGHEPVESSDSSFQAFHRMLTDARIRSSRLLLCSLDKEYSRKTTTLIGKQLELYRALNQREREDAVQFSQQVVVSSAASEDTGTGVFAESFREALCAVTQKKLRETPIKVRPASSPSTNGPLPSAADDITEQYVNVVAQDMSPYSASLRPLGDQTRGAFTNTKTKGTRSVISVSELTNFQEQFKTWRGKYGNPEENIKVKENMPDADANENIENALSKKERNINIVTETAEGNKEVTSL